MYDVDFGNTSVVPHYALAYDNVGGSSAGDYPQVDWGFVTTPQASAAGRTAHYSRGKTLGGR